MSTWWPITLLHVCAVTVGVIAGAAAMVFPKGSGLHRIAGNVFFVSMISGAGAGAFLAAFIHPNRGNVVGSVLTVYLVATAWAAAKRRDRTLNVFDPIALVAIVALGATAVAWGFRAANAPGGKIDDYDAPFFFVFGSIALLFALADLRMILSGGVAGGKRIARHLWRMCLALLFAFMSAYPGQARLFPAVWRETNLLYVPHILVLGGMVFWLYRTRRRRGAMSPTNAAG